MADKKPKPSPSPGEAPPGYNYDEEKAISGMIQDAMGKSGGAGSSGLGSQSVWLGMNGLGGGPSYTQLRMRGYKDKDLLVDYDQARLAPLSWDAETTRKFVNTGIMNKIPGFDVGMGMPEIQGAWDNMVKSSMLFNSKAGGPEDKRWTPWDVMNSYANSKGKFGTVTKGDWVFDVATGERIKYVGKTTRTSTSKKVDLSDPEEARTLVTQMLREMLGRAPNDQELAQFRGSINAYEKANPTVTTTTQQLSPDLATGEVNVTDESSTTTGGVTDAARAALISAPTVETKEYGKYQAATTYWDAMMQMVSGGG